MKNPKKIDAQNQWKIIGAGTYNVAYRSFDGESVFKIAQKNSPTDLPERSVRLWNLINSHIHPPAKISWQIINGKRVKGWICPYIHGIQATDEETRRELLAIFNRTGRIIVDATAANNFKKTRDGQIVCIDFGHALEMEKRETSGLIGLTRKPSFTSLEAWDDVYDTKEGRYWIQDAQKNFPKSIHTIKALLFIKHHRPDITNVGFLRRSAKTILLLAQAYDDKTMREEALAVLAEESSPDLENTKQKCRAIFSEYIQKIGYIDKNENFIPRKRYIKDNAHLERVMTLMKQINTATTCEQCHEIVGDYVAEWSEPSPSSTESVEYIDAIDSTEEVSKSESDAVVDEQWLATFEDLVDEVETNTVLSNLKAKCREILDGYIKFYIRFYSEEDTSVENIAQQTISDFKSKMHITKMIDLVGKLIEDIKQVSSFEALQANIDGFMQKLPARSSRLKKAELSPLDALRATVMTCHILVERAQHAQKSINQQTL
jgi:hypothetical protein